MSAPAAAPAPSAASRCPRNGSATGCWFPTGDGPSAPRRVSVRSVLPAKCASVSSQGERDTLVDADEFAAHVVRYAYPAALVAGARAAADALLALASRGVAPFVVQDRDTALAGLAAQLRRDALGTP